MDRFNKLINFLVVLSVLLAVFLFSTIRQNVQTGSLENGAQVSFLDVGQADATLINLPGSVQILIDGGVNSQAVKQVASRMPKFDRKIEYLVITHPDSDHIGGLPEIFNSYEIDEVIQSKAQSSSKIFEKVEGIIKEKNIKVEEAEEGQKINFTSEAEGLILWPKESEIGSLSLNNTSVVLRLDYKGVRAIFPGDAEIEAQNRILGDFKEEDLRVDLFKAAHHGSANALDRKFLEAIGAKFAVISVGKNNKYGHPTSVVLAALRELNMQILRTDQMGTIDFTSDGNYWRKK